MAGLTRPGGILGSVSQKASLALAYYDVVEGGQGLKNVSQGSVGCQTGAGSGNLGS